MTRGSLRYGLSVLAVVVLARTAGVEPQGADAAELPSSVGQGTRATDPAAESAGEPPPGPADPPDHGRDDTLRRRTLAEDFSDPLTSLPQLFVQDAFTPSSYGTEARANRVVLRAIVPRIPRLSLLPFVQLVRPSIQLVTVPKGRGRGTVTALGDFQLFDLLALPWPDRSSGLYMGCLPGSSSAGRAVSGLPSRYRRQ